MCVYSASASEENVKQADVSMVLGAIKSELAVYSLMDIRWTCDMPTTLVLDCAENSLISATLSERLIDILGDTQIVFQRSKIDNSTDEAGVLFLPGNSSVFVPFLADPREVRASAAYKFGDDVFGKHVAPAGFCNEVVLALLKHRDTFWQISLTAGMFALFNLGEPSHGHVADLQNADYFIGIPVCILKGSLSFRIRFYHISSHIGDDFVGALLSYPGEYAKQIEWGEKPVRQYINSKMISELRLMTEPLLALLKRLGLNERYNRLSTTGTAETWNLSDILSCLNIDMLSSEERALVHAYKNLALGWVFGNKPSYEVLDSFMSMQINARLRVYIGIGIYIRNNPSIDQGKGFWQFGAEWRVIPGIKIKKSLYCQLFSAFNVQYNDMHCWQGNVTYMCGIEMSKAPGMGNKVRLFIVYHNGFSESGMFRYGKESSFSTGISYGV